MRRLLLLPILLILSYSLKSQIEQQPPTFEERQKQIQDSIRDKELLDLLKPLDPALAVPEVTQAPVQNTITPIPVVKDSTNLPTVIPNDTVVSTPPDTTKPKTAATPDTLNIPAQTETGAKDTLKQVPPIPEDTAKNEIVNLPPDTNTTKLAVDSLKSSPDSLKQAPVVVDTIPKTETIAQSRPMIPTDSLRKLPIDSLTAEQLAQLYMDEAEPPYFYRGPVVGDSVYYVLNPLTVPTKTVEGEPLLRFGDDSGDNNEFIDTVNYAEQKLKPKISLGIGRLGFSGDLFTKHFQKPGVGRVAYDLAISHRITRYLQLDFNVLFGKLGADERLNYRQENFVSEIRAGGVNLIYDFGNFIPDLYKVRPFVSFGAYGFEFLSKTDLRDANGNLYYYWSDGSIKDRAETDPEAQFAKDLRRDYVYESDIRELNKDGFGKYPERAWAFPVGAGVIMKVTDRVDVKLNFQYYFTTTDYIDGISNKSVGDRAGTKRKDNYSYTSIAIQYDLIAKKRKRNKMQDTLSGEFWFAFDNADSDNDSVPDMKDDCQGTPEGAQVNAKGCPLDDDNDGIPNYRDDQLNTPPGAPVNARGVSQDDAYWQAWYDQYLNDSLATDRITEYTGNIYASKPVKKAKQKKDNFTVELVRYTGAIPSDELAFLLSIGDINSVTLDDGTTVVYTSGTYDKLSQAIKRRDEFRTTGNKGAGISRIEGKEIVQVGDAELQQLLQAEITDLMNVNIGGEDSVAIANGSMSVPAETTDSEIFGKDEVVYRVQLGAFKNKISTKVFNTSAGVLELKTGENIYRYVTKGYRTIEEAAAVRADLVVQGYSDAFVTAYQGGKRIPMSQTKATVEKGYQEDMSEDKIFNSIDKKLLAFKVQLGPLKKANQVASMDEKVKDLANVEKQTTSTGSIRYTAGGEYSRLDEAEKLRKDLEDKGYTDAFVIAMFKGEIISMQEAMELLK
ncbi:MAG: hypothetical protein JNL60_02495 [Bacteroidia bacterium]|nr:hypothetical protein [Bacteroidia bacterium]